MKRTVTLQVDGKKIFTGEGTTILEAASLNGINIPTLCHHHRIDPLGHCRLCIVEIEGLRRPVTSCDNPVTEGMVVTTNSLYLRDKRKRILELFLTTHPYRECLTCQRTGSCELQEQAYRFQVDLPLLLERAVPGGTNTGTGRIKIVRDEEKCIVCGRCIRVCRSGANRSVYGIIGSGADTRVVPMQDGREVSMEEAGCINCGQCVDVCPVAALSEPERGLGGREWDLDSYRGVCLHCSLQCSLQRCYDQGELIVVRPDPGKACGERLCEKGKYHFTSAGGRRRVTVPLILSSNGYGETGLEEALEKTARALVKPGKNGEKTAVAILSAGRLSNEENFLLQKLAREIPGGAMLNLGAEPGWAGARSRAAAVSGVTNPGPTVEDLEKAPAIMIVGSGLEESHPVASMAAGKAARLGDSTQIRLNSGGGTAGAWSSLDLPCPGGRAGGVLREMAALAGGARSSRGGGAGEDGLKAVEHAVSMLETPGACVIVCPTFFSEAGPEEVEALLDLSESTGLLKRGHSNLLLLSAYPNASGVLQAGGLSGYSPGGRRNGEQSPGSMQKLLDLAGAGTLKAVLTFGSGFSSLRGGGELFLTSVCSSIDEVPPQADLVLPAEEDHEKRGTYSGAYGLPARNDAPVRSPFQGGDGWNLICDLARLMGVEWKYAALEEVQAEMSETAAR